MSSGDCEIRRATVGRSFSHKLTSSESIQERNLACLWCGKISGRQGRMPALPANSGIGERAQGCNSCGKDSIRWSHGTHLVSKASYLSQRMHPTGLTQQSMLPERQTSLPSTLPWCPSVKNTQNNLKNLNYSLEIYKLRKTNHQPKL